MGSTFPVDLQTRRLRYALAVADRLSFTAAAAHLHTSQQGLSDQIGRLESQLGFRLFERTTRSVRLTPAGERFLSDARAALLLLGTAVDEARSVADERPRLRLGFLTGAAADLTDPILDAFTATHPDLDLDLREHPLTDTSAGLRDGISDVAFVRAPLTIEGLDVIVLAAEPRVVAMAREHPLAGRAVLRAKDLEAWPVLGGPGDDPVFTAFWSLQDLQPPPAITSAGRSPSVPEELTVVARGRAVSITAASAARFLPWPGVVFRGLQDCPPSQICVARRLHDDRAHVRAFLACASTATAAHPALIAALAYGGPRPCNPRPSAM
ncbi:LysR substrate-binding domain-containing protein [Jannaschia sp. R86511]|uniref:LysR substrate-binding domain-containing protein n=1 Tax=Jannaschia sp. R86511 TaxID=3093853 RepID=UPI0036D281D6